jgi:hypothetical protein
MWCIATPWVIQMLTQLTVSRQQLDLRFEKVSWPQPRRGASRGTNRQIVLRVCDISVISEAKDEAPT